MGRSRTRAILLTGWAVAVFAVAAANCAAPTQIKVDVRADRALCSLLSTGIAVTTLEKIDDDPLETYQSGCEIDSDRVGTLTITPSGARNDWVGIRVVAAVGEFDPDRCGLPGGETGEPSWEGCILARRRVRFVPGKTVHLTVRLTERCVGRHCGGDLECNLGVCVEPERVQEDGGILEPPDDEKEEVDAAAIVDASQEEEQDACAKCNGTSCNAGECVFDCNAVDCQNQTVCGNGLDCKIECLSQDKCRNTRCATDGKCTFACTGGAGPARHCENIQCAAGACVVTCLDGEGTCQGVHVDGGKNEVKCAPTETGAPTCDDVTCYGGTCARTCQDGGCGSASACVGNCEAWEGDGFPPVGPGP